MPITVNYASKVSGVDMIEVKWLETDDKSLFEY